MALQTSPRGTLSILNSMWSALCSDHVTYGTDWTASEWLQVGRARICIATQVRHRYL